MDPGTELALGVFLVGLATVGLMVRYRKKPMERRIRAWATAHGFKFQPQATVDLSRAMGLPSHFRYEYIVLADMAGGTHGCLYRKRDKASEKLSVATVLRGQDEANLPGELCARILVASGPTGKGVLVPAGTKPPPFTLQMALTATIVTRCPSIRYDLFTDGTLQAKDFPQAFWPAVEDFPGKTMPVLVVDPTGIFIEDPVHRASDVQGYESLLAYANRLSAALAKWRFPSRHPA